MTFKICVRPDISFPSSAVSLFVLDVEGLEGSYSEGVDERLVVDDDG